MSVHQRRYQTTYCFGVEIVTDRLDMILGFLSGVISMGLIALIIGVAFVESAQITLPVVAVVSMALVSLLLLRGVQVKEIRLGDYLTVRFSVTNGDNKE
jgi:cytochrome c biogenesis protein CcdA